MKSREELSNEIEDIIFDSLETMIELKGDHEIVETRIKREEEPFPVGSREEFEDGWQDIEEGPGIILYSEALLSFLLPAITNQEWKDRILDKITKPLLVETLNQILDWTDEKFYGTPYIDFSVDTPFEEDLDFIDSAGFAFSALLYSKFLFEDELSESLLKRMDDRITRAIKVIHECHIGEDQGYSWGRVDKPDKAFLYPSWTAVLTFGEDIYDYEGEFPPDAREYVDETKQDIKYTRRWVEKKFIEEPEEGLDLTKEIIEFPDENLRNTAYYNLYALTVLIFTGSSKETEIEEGLDLLIEKFKSEKVLRDYLERSFDFWFDGKEKLSARDAKTYSDRSFLPLIIKILSEFVKSDEKRWRKYKDELIFFYQELLRSRSDKYEYVWDEDTDYSIFYTERAIEALCRFYQCLQSFERETEESEGQFIEFTTRVPVKSIKEEILSDDEFIDILAAKLKDKRLVEAEFIEELTEEVRKYLESREEEGEDFEEIFDELQLLKGVVREDLREKRED